MIDSRTKQACPRCGSANIETRTTGTAFYRTGGPIENARQRIRCKKVIDRTLRCGECEYDFSEAEEQEF